jgi:hypothetical protein
VVTIQAGENGWTILYADHSSKYSDQLDTVDENFNKAMEVLKLDFDNIRPVTEQQPEEVREEQQKSEAWEARDIMEEECSEEM